MRRGTGSGGGALVKALLGGLAVLAAAYAAERLEEARNARAPGTPKQPARKRERSG